MFIYGLFSTEDNVIRYVGQTRKALKERLREHVNGALKRNGKTYKDNWIRKCYKEGFEVNIKEIEKVDSDIVDEREIFWISQLNNLTNMTPGGFSGRGYIYTETYEFCKKWMKENASDVTSVRLFQDFTATTKFPSFMPINPKGHFTATNEWKGWGDFLSTGRIQDNKIAEKYLSYKDAKRYLRKLHITSKPNYQKYIKENNIDFLPNRPERYYRERGWEGYGLFLNFKKRYEITNELLIRYLNTFFKGVNSLYKYTHISDKLNVALPKCNNSFNKYFPTFDWSKVNKHMICNYKEAKKIVQKNNIKTPDEYNNFVKEKFSGVLPIQPEIKYKNCGWRNWMSFLGNTNIKHTCDITIDVFRRYMKMFYPHINSGKLYRELYVKNKDILPHRLPSRPDISFKTCFGKLFNYNKR